MTIANRRARLCRIMEELHLEAILLRRPANFAWYTGGADNRVDRSSATSATAVLVTSEREYVVTNNIEAPRMRGEETPGLEVVEHPWYESAAPLLRELIGRGAVGTDYSESVSTRDVSNRVASLRRVLDSETIVRYLKVGADTTEAVDEASGALHPDMTEREASARLAASCRTRGLHTPVLLVACERRIASYRHPIPTDVRLEGRVMLVVCAERGGLHANLTRIVAFEEPDKEYARRQAACENILRRMRLEATHAGRTLGDAFEDCTGFYEAEGYSGGWKYHHQGGLTGYAAAEQIASQNSEQEILPGQTFSWNPSLAGAKAEDTFVLTDSGPQTICPRYSSETLDEVTT